MVHSIERSTDIKKSQECYFRGVNGRVYIGEKTEKQCLGGMTFPKARLDTREKIVSLKVRRHLEGDDLLNDFRDERYVGDWSIVDWVVRIKSLALESWDENRSLLRRW